MSKRHKKNRNTNKLVENKDEKAWDPGVVEEISMDDFRGFEKVPKVLCERMDITPYLNKTDTYMTELKEPDQPKVIKIDLASNRPVEARYNKLLHKCSVFLVRDDLDQLIEIAKNNSPIFNCSVKCNICDKVYSDMKKLKYHIENKHIICKPPKTPKRVSFSDHVIVHEVTEYHKCKKCTKIFEAYDALKHHMKQEHGKEKCYICIFCSKEFVDRMLFKVHIKLHCDACGLLLSNKKKYQEHRRNVCKIVKRYECKTCHMVFFRFMDLKDHSYDHLGIFFICDICKDQFDTKCGVSHHINFLHSKRRPESLYTKQTFGIDQVYVCNFCEESAVEEYQMENHVSSLPDLQNRATTGYKDYYFCNQCLKKFSTETDMLQHKWTHFLRNNPENLPEATESVMKSKYKVGEELPKLLKPKIVLERLKIPKPRQSLPIMASPIKAVETSVLASLLESPMSLQMPSPMPVPTPTLPAMLQLTKPLSASTNFIKINNLLNGELKKPIVDPFSKRTIVSKHQCELCSKYLSSNSSLKRHMHDVHGISKEGNLLKSSLQCSMCEEVFVWPSLLQSHNCIRMSIPEMPFDDARPEIHFDNLNEHRFDDLEITENEDYMQTVDFEIPAQVVQLTEYDNLNLVNDGNRHLVNNEKTIVNNLGFKILMQEVPIEF